MGILQLSDASRAVPRQAQLLTGGIASLQDPVSPSAALPHALPNARALRRQLALRHLWPPGLLLGVGDLLYLVEKCIRNFKLRRG